jgi:hypothetical protein
VIDIERDRERDMERQKGRGERDIVEKSEIG